MKIIFLISILASLSYAAGDYSQSRFESAEIENMLIKMNKTLDFYNPEIVKKIPKLENEFVSISETKKSDLKSEDSGKRAIAAKVMIYLALYMTNSNSAAEQGKLSFVDLTQFKKFSDKNDLTNELIERQKKIIGLLSSAGEALSDYARVWAWLAGAKISLARYQSADGTAAVSELISVTEKFPNFNLFSLLGSTRQMNLTDEQNLRILKLVEMEVDKTVSCPVDKVTKKIRCARGIIAPFTRETGRVYMADALLKSNTQENRKKAERILEKIKTDEDILVWPNQALAKHRIKAAFDLSKGRKISSDFWNKEETIKIYQCASCHSQ